jgi:hypothetical protein
MVPSCFNQGYRHGEQGYLMQIKKRPDGGCLTVAAIELNN